MKETSRRRPTPEQVEKYNANRREKRKQNLAIALAQERARYATRLKKCITCDAMVDPYASRCKSCHYATKKGKAGNLVPMRGPDHPKWIGGRVKTGMGHIWVQAPDHPNRNPNGYILEHRLVMEKKLGRYLNTEEVVHHINEIKDDNRIENLELLKNQSEHQKRHCISYPRDETGKFLKEEKELEN